MQLDEGFIEEFQSLDSRQFAIAIRKLADSLSYGVDKSPFVGGGTEYVQSRPYQYGDPVRAIDWRVTARTRVPFVKEYEAPKSVPAYFFIDTSASMTISSGRKSKYELALYIAGGLALACLDRVSPVGLIGVGERTMRVQPSLSRARVLQWLLQLRTFRFDERTRLGTRINEVGPSFGERSLIVILSDMHDQHAITAIKHTSQRHDCVVLQLVDPVEKGLRGSGFFRAREAETGHEFVTRGQHPWVDVEAHVSDLRRVGVDHVILRTDEPCAAKLRHMFKSRGAAARGAR